MKAHLGLDVGGTASRWVACDAQGIELARGKGPGATGHLFNPAERERLQNALHGITADVTGCGLQPISLTAGLTGFGSSVLPEMEALLAATFAVEPHQIVVADDIFMAYLANFAPGEAHLVSAGTGSIGVHIGEDVVVRVGGRGILIDDGGSGSWIALRALDRLYRDIDMRGPSASDTPLARELFTAIGGGDWPDVRQFIYAGDRGRIGVLATAVAKAAGQGDATALALLQEAGTELARLAQALIARVGERPVGLIGGVLKLHPAILEAVRAALPETIVTVLEADTALAAARLQQHGDARWKAVLQSRGSIG